MSKQKRYSRYLILLLILLAITVHNAYVYTSVRSWQRTLSVMVYPSNGDGLASTDEYIQSLTKQNIEEIARFINSEANRYGVKDVQAIDVQLSAEKFGSPPRLPRKRNVFSNIYWSLYFRGWANFQLYTSEANVPDIALFAVFFDPKYTERLGHSIGLAGSMIAVINVFADRQYQGSNNVVITHELLHTVGASDKYDATTNLPLFPQGFANPEKSPVYPQTQAEIMGGRIPLSADRAVMPSSLQEIIVGRRTALEMHWPVAIGE
ncbi:MAG: hypothetical protein ACR2P1_06020 [Pseudomonadales bacterium]